MNSNYSCVVLVLPVNEYAQMKNDFRYPGIGSWYLFGVTVVRPSLFQEVRGWGTPWPRALARGTVEGGGFTRALTSLNDQAVRLGIAEMVP